MTSSDRFVSTRLFLDRWFLAVILVAFGLAIVGGYVTYDAHIDGAETAVEQQTTGSWTVESEFEHAATVQRETDVFSSGERLEHRPLYFTTIAPRLNGTYTLTHDNTGGEPATASIELSLIVRAVEEIDETEVVHWQRREVLETLDAVEIGDGNEESTTVSINVSTVLDRIESIQTDLGANPGETEALIIADTVIEGSVADETFTDTRTDRIEVDPNPTVYRVSTTVQDPGSYEATRRVTRTVEPSILSLFGGPLLLILGLLGATGLGLADWYGGLAVTERERARQEFETARNDFDEWISSVEIPETGNRTTVRADTLADLVDVAIDSDRRVLEDDDRYAVIVEDIIYVYTAPTIPDPLEEPDETDAGSAQENDVDETNDE